LRDTTRPGCLGALLALLRIKPRSTSTHVYRLRDDFLSPAESSFLRTLLAICGDGVLVCPKVNLADLVYAPRQEGQFAAWNRINRKHLDFVLCDMDSLRPRLAIELDDKSHSRQDRRERDDFVDGVLESCGLPLLRVPARRAYNPAELREAIARAWSGMPISAAQVERSHAERRCERCGGLMELRSSSRGQFWGCTNYPRCRHTLPA